MEDGSDGENKWTHFMVLDFKYFGGDNGTRLKRQSYSQTYSDDTVIVGCVENGQEDEYRNRVESFVRWSRENLLQLNVTKTKEMVVDFSKSKSPPSPVCISGKEVEIVPSYRFLGVQLDNKLEWSTNTDADYKKAMSRLYFLRRLRSFSVCSRMLHMFYQSVMASTIFFAAVCWGTGIKAKDTNGLNKLIKKAGSVVGCNLANLDEVVRDRMVLKLRTIMDRPPPATDACSLAALRNEYQIRHKFKPHRPVSMRLKHTEERDLQESSQ
ncbi:hypothetical protein D4764_03G0011280 [Takifugu flavidus]|uniref:Alkylated DNA repair protein AlkB homologue 8 N-terminal domain-containing protein n=1 Tax=Takifugu flavidus TaxID=433684 RepID=A0A5C6NDU0_9TELE|nr:hypothetical protein D4764_03G0011280 [Takifugu flavidus]